MSENTQFLINSRGRKYILKTRSIREHILKIEEYTNYCAICDKKLTEKCSDCENDPEHFYETQSLLEPSISPEVLKTIFPCFPKEIIQHIIDLIPKNGHLFNKCPIVVGECKHIFHNHCINKWRYKRDCCPLDNNEKWVSNKMDSYVDYNLFPY